MSFVNIYKKNIAHFVLVFFVSLLGSVAWALSQFQIPSDAGTLNFQAVGKPAMIRIKGESSKGPEGNIEVNGSHVSGVVKFSLENLTTGIETRDKHMKEKYLEVGKFPTATLNIKKLQIEDINKSSKADFEGDLTLHGETHPVTGTVTYEVQELKRGLASESATGVSIFDRNAHAEFKLNISKYNIPVPSYLGITVAEEVTVSMAFKINEAKL